jgi:AcrR family transcriptional regulator
MQYLSQRLAVEPVRARDEERPRGAIVGDQRERLLDATEALIAEKGAARTTIEAIVKAAGVSTVTFYEHFRDKDECFVAAFGGGAARRGGCRDPG